MASTRGPPRAARSWTLSRMPCLHDQMNSLLVGDRQAGRRPNVAVARGPAKLLSAARNRTATLTVVHPVRPADNPHMTSKAPDRTPLLFASLRGFQPAWLPDDALAGLLLAATALPQQLATARLAGLPPATGLIAFICGTLGFAVFGTNRFLSCGADSTIASIFAGGLAAITVTASADYANAAALLALLVGGILVAAALLRAGWIADLLSAPVITGLLAG